MRTSLSLAAIAALCFSTSVRAQAPVDLTGALERWRVDHGSGWRIERDSDSGFASMLYGGRLDPARAPRADEDYARIAREALDATAPLHGVESELLALDHVLFLPLAQVGTTDKITVRFRQSIAGVEVPEGAVNVLLDLEGRVLSVQTRAVPRLAEVSTVPTIDAARALVLARRAFEADEGLPPNDVRPLRLAIVRAPRGSALPGRLAWITDVRFTTEDAIPIGFEYRIDAHSGEVLSREATVHEFEVRGTVRANASPGVAPDTSGNPEVATAMRYLTVTSSLGTASTDTSGNFSYPSASSTLSVTVGFTGPFANVQNTAGSEYTLTSSLPPNQNNTLTMNPSSSAQITAQANAFHHTNVQRDFIRATNPLDSKGDFTKLANVNLSQTCNAFFDGGSTNYFLSGGGCVNTAYSTVVGHELGHWMNVVYGTGNGPDGMGEGNADVWAMYTYDDPVVGLGFCGGTCSIRTGLNTNPFCGDLTPTCYGQVHADGEPWMGAAWKVRANLKAALGTTSGGLTANALFLAWMNAFNQTQIRSIIETQWLLLDDDDGNLFNGSPHYPQIDAGFRAQAFPGVDLVPISFDSITAHPDTEVELGPYDVTAQIAQNLGGTITGASLSWRVNNGAWNLLPLVPQGARRYRASIPPQPAPAQVDYYVTTSDDQGNTLNWPVGGASASHAFRIGSSEPFFVERFDAGTAGWTHGSYGDTSSNANDWQWGDPTGESGTAFQGTNQLNWRDPLNAFSAPACFGTDLGVGGSNGQYASNVHTWLRSPPLDCSASIGTKLRFRRWLSVQASAFDAARVRVNGSIAWTNPAGNEILDQSWQVQEVDISDWADGNASTVIEFELLTNGQTNLGGWAVDDVELVRLGGAVAGQPAPHAYGPGKVNSTGLAGELYGSGEPSLASNQFAIYLHKVPANALAMLYSSHAPSYAPLFGGTFLIATPFVREIAWQTSPFGDAWSDFPVQPWMVGTTRFYQAVHRDPSSPDGFALGMTSALRVDYAP